MQIRSVGIDLGKTTFHLVALSDNGKVLLKKKLTQKQLIAFTANMQTCLIGMEACSGSHFLGRALREQGPEVKLIPAQFVKPFVVTRTKSKYLSHQSCGFRYSSLYLQRTPKQGSEIWWAHQDLNLEPKRYEHSALTN